MGALQLLRHAGAAHPLHDRRRSPRAASASTRPRPAPIYGTYVSLVYILRCRGAGSPTAFSASGGRRSTAASSSCWGTSASRSLRSRPSTPGSGLVTLGTGLLKPNISTLVGELYTPEDVRRDAGFSLYYMGINTGAFIAPLVCGWFAQSEQFRGILASAGIAPESAWHWGFGDGGRRDVLRPGAVSGRLEAPGHRRHVSRAGGVAGAGGVATAPAATGTRRGSGRRRAPLAALRREHRANHRPGREQCPRSRSPDHDGRVLRLDVPRGEVDDGGAQAAGRGAGAVRGGDDLLVGVRAGGLDPQSLRPAGHQDRGVRVALPAELAAVGSALPPGGALPGLRLDLVAACAIATPPAPPSSPSGWCACP